MVKFEEVLTFVALCFLPIKHCVCFNNKGVTNYEHKKLI